MAMTPEEHEFMLFLFVRHETLIGRIVDVLGNTGALTASGRDAWNRLLAGGEPIDQNYYEQMKQRYTRFAREFGIQVAE